MELSIAELRALTQPEPSPMATSGPEGPGDIRIVVLDRGFVYVGRYFRCGKYTQIRGGANVRKWGTSRGLGQLAMEGPQADTKLDPCPTVEVLESDVRHTLLCDPSKWSCHVNG